MLFFVYVFFCLNCIYLPHPSSLMMGASQPKMSLVGVRCLFAIQYFCLICIHSIIMEIGIRCCFCMGFFLSQLHLFTSSQFTDDGYLANPKFPQ